MSQSDLFEPSGSPVVEVIPGGRVEGRIRPPGSKSLTNRALICAAFAEGESILEGALRSEDTEVMIAALRQIGVGIEEQQGGRRLRVVGVRRSPEASPSRGTDAEIFVANSGTTVRFLTAALSAFGGRYRLSGVERMHARPIGDLVEALRPVIRGSIEAVSPGACPPVLIDSDGWSGSELEVGGSVSSQFLSGLMMAAPISGRAIRLRLVGELVSRPYVEMTAEVMRAFGATVECDDLPDGLLVRVGADAYVGRDQEIEPDASAASYFWAAAAITGGAVRVEGLDLLAMQGDVGFCEVLARMGCEVIDDGRSLEVRGGPLRGIDVDMNAVSDTVQTLAVVAMFADGPTRVRGVAHNRFKETDRIGDLARELRKLGVGIEEHDDGLTIVPPRDRTELHGATLETYQDHRMAMSLSLAGLRLEGVKILDPACTAKTYPEYFADLESLLGRSHRWGVAEG